MHPSGIVLAKTYRFSETTESKAGDWGEILWRLLRQSLAVPVPSALRGPEQYDYLTDRLTNYVHARLVIRGAQIIQTYKNLPSAKLDAALNELVESVLDLSPDQQGNIVWHLNKVCHRIKYDATIVSPGQMKTIRRFAAENSHRCRFCGHSLIYKGEADEVAEDIPEDAAPEVKRPADFWAFEIEHLFPQKRGGSRARLNLAASCKSCNKFKDVHINFSDFPVETYLTGSEKSENIKSAFGGAKKFALLWRQGGCCARCDVPFFEASDERLVLLRRDREDAFHFFNVEIACGDCGAQDEEGVEIRA